MMKKNEENRCLKLMVKNIMIDSFTAGRMRSDSFFVKTLVRSLQVKNSFYYPFDSLQSISRLYAPDSSFRIITWQLDINANLVIQHGAIQIRTPDGSLKLFPLIGSLIIIILGYKLIKINIYNNIKFFVINKY